MVEELRAALAAWKLLGLAFFVVTFFWLLLTGRLSLRRRRDWSP